MLLQCTNCGGFVSKTEKKCPVCGIRVRGLLSLVRRADEAPAATTTGESAFQLDHRQILGLVGCLLLIMGVFSPVVWLPVFGRLNYFRNGQGDGVLVLVLAGASFVFVLARKFGGLWFTAIGSAAVMAFTFVNFRWRLSEVTTDLRRELSDNPFRGVADIAVESVQFEWGWGVLIAGVALLISAAAVRSGVRP